MIVSGVCRHAACLRLCCVPGLPPTAFGEAFAAAAGSDCDAGSVGSPTDGPWFVKHRRGIKGKQVERHVTAAAARAWLDRLPVAGPGLDPDRHPNDQPTQSDYVVQLEVNGYQKL